MRFARVEYSPAIYREDKWRTDNIVKEIREGRIVFQPSRTRWSVRHQAMFIESVIRGFPISPLILVEQPVQRDLRCVDGRRRLTALLDFYDNKFTLNTADATLSYTDLETTLARCELSFYVFNDPSIERELLYRTGPIRFTLGELIDNYRTPMANSIRDVCNELAAIAPTTYGLMTRDRHAEDRLLVFALYMFLGGYNPLAVTQQHISSLMHRVPEYTTIIQAALSRVVTMLEDEGGQVQDTCTTSRALPTEQGTRPLFIVCNRLILPAIIAMVDNSKPRDVPRLTNELLHKFLASRRYRGAVPNSLLAELGVVRRQASVRTWYTATRRLVLG
jgi:hypothetical protein